MQTFIDIIVTLTGLVADTLSKHPFFGAVLGLLAIAVFFWLRNEWEIGIDKWMRLSLLLIAVVIGWALLVALVGWVFDVLGFAADSVKFIYGKFEQQTVFFLTVSALAIFVSVIWYFFPRSGMNRFFRLLCVLGGWFLLIAVGTPLMNVFNSPASTSASADKDLATEKVSRQKQVALTNPPPTLIRTNASK